MDSITCRSNSKINLFLEIIGKRPDGYHEICTLFQEVSLGDELTVRKIDEDYSILKCNDTTVPFGKRNLCIKAYDMVRENTPLKKTVEITLVKKVPLGAGLGGGSSNGASVIKCLNELFKLGMDAQGMADLAAKIGSDVPFFIYGGTAVGRGRGEHIHKIQGPVKPIWLAIVKPNVSVSTGNAYQWVKGYKGKKTLSEEEISAKLQAGDLDYIAKLMFNAFEPVVFAKHPELEALKKDIEGHGCVKAMMSGCGSALYAICDSQASAEGVAAAFKEREDIVIAEACHTL